MGNEKFAIIEYKTKDNTNAFVCVTEIELATQETKLSKEYATITRIVRAIESVDKLSELAIQIQERLDKGMMLQ